MKKSVVSQIFPEIQPDEDCFLLMSNENKIIIYPYWKKYVLNFLGTESEAKLKPDTYEHFVVTAFIT